MVPHKRRTVLAADYTVWHGYVRTYTDFVIKAVSHGRFGVASGIPAQFNGMVCGTINFSKVCGSHGRGIYCIILGVHVAIKTQAFIVAVITTIDDIQVTVVVSINPEQAS